MWISESQLLTPHRTTQKIRLYVWECCPHTSWTPASLVPWHCLREPLPVPDHPLSDDGTKPLSDMAEGITAVNANNCFWGSSDWTWSKKQEVSAALEWGYGEALSFDDSKHWLDKAITHLTWHWLQLCFERSAGLGTTIGSLRPESL